MYSPQLLVLLFLLGPSFTKVSEEQQVWQTGKKTLNILMLSLPSVGHLTPTLSFVDEAVSRGHKVTVCMGPAAGELSKHEDSEGLHYEIFESNVTAKLVEMVDRKRGLFAEFSTKLALISEYSSLMMLKLKTFMKQDKFDIIIGNEFMVPPLLCASSKWNTPVVVIGSLTQMFVHQYPPWAWPGLLQGRESDNLPFHQRIISSFDRVFSSAIFKYMFMARYKNDLLDSCPSVSLEQYSTAPGFSIPHIVPTVIGFEFPRTLVPLVEYVGPLLRKNPHPLSQDLKNWLKKKPERSVVYISMGSKYKLTKEQSEALLDGVMATNLSLIWSLRRTNQWVLEGKQLDHSRVYLSEWTPQFSVLSSTAIHSAILHGGFNGLNEALSNGVPVLGIPCTDEQVLNIGRLTHNGLGLSLEKDRIISTDITNALLSLGNGGYRLKVDNLRKMFKLAGGPKRAVDLVEGYAEVGYAHLVPAHIKFKWTWIEYYNADVWLVVASIILLVSFCALKCFALCLKKCGCRSTGKVKRE